MGTKRDDYMGKLKAILAKWDSVIERMQFKALNAGMRSKELCEQQVDGMKANRRKIGEKMDELRKTSGAAWTDLNEGVVKSRLDLDQAAEAAREEAEESASVSP